VSVTLIVIIIYIIKYFPNQDKKIKTSKYYIESRGKS